MADVAIWVAYLTIPAVTLYYLRQRQSVPFPRLFVMFSLFILACGVSHLLDAAAFWWPAYRLSALVKLLTATVSCVTAIALIPIVPAALLLRTPNELQREIERRTRELTELNHRLRAEVEQRRSVSASFTHSQHRLHLALQAGGMGTWYRDLTTNRIRLDDVEQQLTGFTDNGQGIHVDTFMERVHPDDRAQLLEALEASITTGCNYRHEFRFCMPDGSVRWLAGRGRVITDERNVPTQFLGINYDVTERRQTQEILNLRTRALESATNAILMIDISQSSLPVVDVNSAFLDLSRYSREELFGKPFDFLASSDADPTSITPLQQAIRNRGECATTLLCCRKDGSTFWSDVQISPVVSDRGETSHYIGVFTDITARVASEQELLRAREQAETANDAKTQFLANMSHEIRTPLTAILGCADTLYRQQLDDDSVQLVKLIKDQGELLLGVLNDVLDVAKIEAGRLEVRLENCEIVPIVADVRSLMQPQASDHGLQLATVYESKLPALIRTDPLRLRQILLNLTSNAIKYTPSGQVQIRVRYESSNERGTLIIDVADTGIGIPADQVEAIFEPFTQSSAVAHRTQGGVGLGLTICRKLIDLLGGEIRVESRVGSGSCFSVRLPLGTAQGLKLQSASEFTPSVPEEISPETLSRLAPCRILVAEDTRGLQFMLRQMLREFVRSVTVVSNGEEAITAVKSAENTGENFDLILMDMQMPVLNGFEATMRLRSLGCKQPIIALTAGAMGGDREKCLNAGCTDYLTKPVDRARLLTTLVEYSQSLQSSN